MSETPPSAPPSRRGTETRQRTRHVDVRCTDAERATIAAAADRAGMTVGAFMRHQATGTAGPRAARRRIPQQVELGQLLRHIGHLGGNVNQLAKAFNTDGTTPEAVELAAVHAHILAMRAAVMEALGRRA